MALLFLDASETEVMAQVKEYLRLNAYFYPTLGLLFILRNGLQGMSYSFLPYKRQYSQNPEQMLHRPEPVQSVP